jgi:cation:H+ antiporter
VSSLVRTFESTGIWAPWWFLALFIAASFVMIWGLEHMTAMGVGGTVLGTLVMPYCSGLPNLIFVFVVARAGGPGSDVIVNGLVNNVTNLTLLIGLPAVIWGMNIMPERKGAKKRKGDVSPRVNRLALMLTLAAVLFFTGALWALGRDGEISFYDGLILIGLFLFWQCFHVFEVMKENARQNKSFPWIIVVDLAILLVGAWAIYVSTDWLVAWVLKQQSGLISARYLGWLSGWLMVLPNAMLALYYGWQRRPEIVYSSQVGDGHICIPLCVGIAALHAPCELPAFFNTGVRILVGVAVMHFGLVAVLGRLPRTVGLGLLGVYGYFLYRGLLSQ